MSNKKKQKQKQGRKIKVFLPEHDPQWAHNEWAIQAMLNSSRC